MNDGLATNIVLALDPTRGFSVGIASLGAYPATAKEKLDDQTSSVNGSSID